MSKTKRRRQALQRAKFVAEIPHRASTVMPPRSFESKADMRRRLGRAFRGKL